MCSQLEKAINLAQRTGDKIIIVDEKKGSSVVVMDISEYEMMFEQKQEKIPENIDIKSLTEEELLDKINRDIVMWQNKEENSEIEDMEDDFVSLKDEPSDEETEDENIYYYDDPEKIDLPIQKTEKDSSSIHQIIQDKKDNKNNWQISKEIKKRAEDVK